MPGKKEWFLSQLGSQHILSIFCPFFSISRRWNINLFSHLTLHNCRTMTYLLDSIKYTATSQVTYGIIRFVVSVLISSQRFLRFVIQYDRKKQLFFHICYLSYRKSSGEIVPSCPQPKSWHLKLEKRTSIGIVLYQSAYIFGNILKLTFLYCLAFTLQLCVSFCLGNSIYSIYNYANSRHFENRM